jgi:hypothetical protein
MYLMCGTTYAAQYVQRNMCGGMRLTGFGAPAISQHLDTALSRSCFY